MDKIHFDEFEVDMQKRCVTRYGKPVKVGARAFDILRILITSPGEVVSKRDLINAVWPETFVSEGALRVHLVSLRKALGVVGTCPYIKAVPGRGYAFIAEVQESPAFVSNAGGMSIKSCMTTTLPEACANVLGRDEFVQAIVDDKTARITTIVGGGGVGKTAVAIKAAHATKDRYKGAAFIDLSNCRKGDTIATSLASSLGVNSSSTTSVASIVEAIENQDFLIVLDSCEHIIGAAAELAETLLTRCRQLSIIATSREPLRICGEKVRRLEPLEVPSEGLPSHEISTFASIELFVDKITQSPGDFADEQEALLEKAAEIVRLLDGVPLPIEMAARRVADLGLANLVLSLRDSLAVLTLGYRTAPHRQQTFKASLDWSFDRLGRSEARLLETLSVFPNAFTFETARTVAERLLEDGCFEEALAGLVLKSLVSRNEKTDEFHLLRTVRTYVRQRAEPRQLQALSGADICEMAGRLSQAGGHRSSDRLPPLSSWYCSEEMPPQKTRHAPAGRRRRIADLKATTKLSACGARAIWSRVDGNVLQARPLTLQSGLDHFGIGQDPPLVRGGASQVRDS